MNFAARLNQWRSTRVSAEFEIAEQLNYVADNFAVSRPAPHLAAASAPDLMQWVINAVSNGLPPLLSTWATELPTLNANWQTLLTTAHSRHARLLAIVGTTLEPPYVLLLAVQLHTLEIAIRLSLQTFESYSQALALQAAINDLITGVIEFPIMRALLSGDDLQGWAALRVDMADNLAQQRLILPTVQHVAVSYPLPAVVVAYRLYRDANRFSELVSRNRLPHPGFCAGDLEYLKDPI